MKTAQSLFMMVLSFFVVSCSSGLAFEPLGTPTPLPTPTLTLEQQLEGRWNQLAAGSATNIVFFETGQFELVFVLPNGDVFCAGDYQTDNQALQLEGECPRGVFGNWHITLTGNSMIEAEKLTLSNVVLITKFSTDSVAEEQYDRMVFEKQ